MTAIDDTSSTQSAHIDGARPEAARKPAAPKPVTRDFSLIIAPLALALVAYPALVVLQPEFRGQFLIAISTFLIPFVALRLSEIGWPGFWLLALSALYAFSSWFGTDRSQGITHTLALICTSTTFLAFSLYGASLLKHQWVRICVWLIIPVNLLAIHSGEFPKNATGGALIYTVAVACVAGLYHNEARSLRYAFVFFAAGVFISFSFGVRSLVIYSGIFILAFALSGKLSKKAFWFAGIATSVGLVLATIWFFLNIESSPILAEISIRIREITGERANSGRDFLWPYILNAVADNQLFGLGAGTLPRDILNTQLSSHNNYLQVYMQLGLVGLAVLGAFLLTVWGILARSSTGAGRFGASLFLMFVVHNGTEVLMFQNQTLIGIPAWCAIGLAIALNRDASDSPGTVLQNRLPDDSNRHQNSA